MTPVQMFLRKLCEFYPSQGQPHRMNDTQIEVYLSALARFSPQQLDQAGKRYMLTGKFFPALSELLELLEPKTDSKAIAELAWGSVLQAIRAGGIYRGATFQTGAVGEAMRQVFGSWSAACSFDTDSPGWAIRRTSFLTIFPTLLNRPMGPVTLAGLHGSENAYRVPALQGAPVAAALPAREQDPQFSRDEAKGLLAAMAARRKEGKP
jgi:hypothetical protein